MAVWNMIDGEKEEERGENNFLYLLSSRDLHTFVLFTLFVSILSKHLLN